MIEHLSLPCRDSKKSRDFFEQALGPIGYEQDWVYGDSFAFKHKGRHDFWVTPGKLGTPIHLAFTCDTRAMVDAFYEAALAAGATDNGAPGLRPAEDYGPNYYAAFVIDRDGNNIEAVSFATRGGASARRKKSAAPKRTAPRKKAAASASARKRSASKRRR